MGRVAGTGGRYSRQRVRGTIRIPDLVNIRDYRPRDCLRGDDERDLQTGKHRPRPASSRAGTGLLSRPQIAARARGDPGRTRPVVPEPRLAVARAA
jgi:hypothetical protein